MSDLMNNSLQIFPMSGWVETLPQTEKNVTILLSMELWNFSLLLVKFDGLAVQHIKLK